MEIIGLLWLAFSIWGLFNVWTSGAGTGSKLIWTVVMLVFNVLGVIAWYFFGPKSAAA